MIVLYIVLGIIALIYVLLLCVVTGFLYKDFKSGKAISLVPKGKDKFLYLFFPVFLPFVLISYCRILSNKGKYSKSKQSVLTNLFGNDTEKLKAFEEYIRSRCGTFDVSFYHVLDSIDKLNENELTCSNLYDMVSQHVSENNIKIEKNKISQAAYDLLSCYYRKKYNENDTQRILRLRKAGYKVRPTELGRDEEKHSIICEYEGNENNCPKDCDSCVISLKTDADICLMQKNYEEAIEKYKLVVQKEPRFAEAWNNLASAYGFLGNHSSALEAYLKATDIDPMYGKALWGASMALINLGRESEAMTVLNNLLEYYDFKEANNRVADLKKKRISPISVCRNLESQCYSQIALIANNYGLKGPANPDTSMIAKKMFEEIYSPFFDFLVVYYDKVNNIKLSKVSSEFMLFAGMASAKYYYKEKGKVLSEGIVKLLSTPKGFYAMDEYCCEYLGIQFVPDKGNALSPCIAQMTEEANRIYSDIINQVKTVAQVKTMVHDISSSFFNFGYNYIESLQNNSLPIDIQPKNMSKRDMLALRLKAMANDPAIKTVKRSEGAMCYSIQMPEEETYKCDHCGCNYNDTPENGVVRYYEDIRKMGYDCKLERWCRDCCIKEGFDVSKYSKSEYVFYIRLDSGEEYRRSDVSYYCLQILYHFFKNENMYSGGFGRTEFVGESTKTIERILGIKIK